MYLTILIQEVSKFEKIEKVEGVKGLLPEEMEKEETNLILELETEEEELTTFEEENDHVKMLKDRMFNV